MAYLGPVNGTSATFDTLSTPSITAPGSAISLNGKSLNTVGTISALNVRQNYGSNTVNFVRPLGSLFVSTAPYASTSAGAQTAYSFTLPASSLGQQGDTVEINIIFQTASNANAKQIGFAVNASPTTVFQGLLPTNTTALGEMHVFITRAAYSTTVHQTGIIIQGTNIQTIGTHDFVLSGVALTSAVTLTVRVNTSTANDILIRSCNTFICTN